MAFKMSEKDVKLLLMGKISRMINNEKANMIMAYVVANKFKSTRLAKIVKKPGCILIMCKSGVSFAVTAPNSMFEVARTDPEIDMEKMDISTANTILKMFPKFDKHLDNRMMVKVKAFSTKKWKSRDHFRKAVDKLEEKTRYFMMNMPELTELRRLMQIGNVI